MPFAQHICCVRPAQPSEAALVAPLIMEAMGADCCQWFVGPNHTLADFRLALETLFACRSTQYSYLNTLCAYADGELVGVLIAYDGGRLRQLRRPFLQLARERWQRNLFDMPDETSAGELYIDTLAVRSDFRRKGIAASLVKAAAEHAFRLRLPRIGLLVDNDNFAAQRFYRRIGLKELGVNMWGGKPMKHLVLNVPAEIPCIVPIATAQLSTPLGVLSLCVDNHALLACRWQGLNAQPDDTSTVVAPSSNAQQLLAEACAQLSAYFNGTLRTFNLPLRLYGTPFQQQVWNGLLDIPFGSTATYGHLAAQLGREGGSRAVAQAAKWNPVDVIIPCHRLVGKYSVGGYCGTDSMGVDIKTGLLAHEGLFFPSK